MWWADNLNQNIDIEEKNVPTMFKIENPFSVVSNVPLKLYACIISPELPKM